MANAYSVLRARQGWINPTDQDFTLKGLMFKQQKYEANQFKVQSIVDKYQALQLARGVDRDYLNERLTGLVNSANSLGPQDLGSNGVTSAITNHIGQVLDENVMTAIQETSKIKSYQEYVAKLQEKNPELYNPLNEAFGLSPAQDYLNNKEVGAKIQGSLTYTPFKDVQGEMSKYLTDIQKSAKNGTIQVPVMQAEIGPDGQPTGKQVRTGEMKTVTINGLSGNELQHIAMSFMGNKYDDQIKINTWGSTGGFKNMGPVVEKATQQYGGIIDEKTKELASLNSLKTGNVTQEEKDNIDVKIKNVESQILDAKSMQTNLRDNPAGSLVYLEKQRMAMSSGQALGLLQTISTEYKKDDYYFGVLSEQRENRKEAFDINKDTFDRQYKTRQLELEEMKIAQKGIEDSTKSASEGGAGGAGAIPITFSTEGIDADAGPQESAHNTWKADISAKYQEQHRFGADVMNKVTRIANGSDQSTPEKVTAAKALLNSFKSQGGALDPTNGAQVQKFMKEFSRADAYSDLTFLPVQGNRAIQVKSTYDNLYNDWSSTSQTYKKAKDRAIMSARKNGGNYADDLQFVEDAKKNSSGVHLDKTANITVNTKNKGTLQSLIGVSEEAKVGGGSYILANDSGIKIKNLKNGNYQLTFQTESKAGGDDKMLVNQTVTVSEENLHNFIPQMKGVGQKQSRFTLENMGTKPVFSPSVAFYERGSNNYENYKESLQGISTKYSTDSRMVDSGEAKTFAKEVLNIKGVQNPQLREQLTQLVDAALSPGIIKNIKTSVYYDYSTTSEKGKGYVGIHAKNGSKIMTVSLGQKDNLEEETKLNQYLPQVIYSRGVIQKLSEVVSESIKSNKLTLTPEIEKLIANGQ